jgi:hypothetical protein
MRRFPRAARSTCICSAAALVAVGAAWQARGHETVRELPYGTPSLGAIAFPTPTVRVFRSNEELQRYVARAEPGTSVGDFDFSRSAGFVLVTTGPRSSSGYSIDVARVVEERSRIVVHAVERAPRLGDAVRPEVTSPYRLLAFAQLDKPVAVEWAGR